MWLLNCETFQLEPFEGENHPPYAILSHRWEGKEVSFQDVMAGRHTEMEGWQKIRSCCEQAKREELKYVWADTCCIDKRSSAELSEAINSMYKWYKQANICYAYLADVVRPETSRQIPDTSEQESTLSHEASEEEQSKSSGQALIKSVWFTRGWTLQELLAPERLEFYDHHWRSLGTRNDSATCRSINGKTGIPYTALQNFKPEDHCIAEKMTWAAGRKTSRVEDRTYSLLGLFEINMPLLYGEGDKAFERLQYELIRTSVDTTIYAWSIPILSPSQTGPLASSPDCYHWNHPELYRWFNAKETSISKEGISGRFRVAPVCLDVLAASVGVYERVFSSYRNVIIFLKKVDHNLYRRALLDGRGYAVIKQWDRPQEDVIDPLITIRLDPISVCSSQAIYECDEECTYSLLTATPGLLLSTRISKMINKDGFWSTRIGRLFASLQGRGLQNRPLSVGLGSDSSACVLLRQEIDHHSERIRSLVVVRFSFDIAFEPTATAYLIQDPSNWGWELLDNNQWFNNKMPEQYRDRCLIVSERGNWKFCTARYTAKDWEALTSAFHEIDKERANGVKVQQLGRDIKVAFLYARYEHDYRIFLAFRDTKHCDKLPREWLYPPPEGPEAEFRYDDGHLPWLTWAM